MEATPFNTDEKKLWMMCTLRFCTNTDDTTCDEVSFYAPELRGILVWICPSVRLLVYGQESLEV